MERAPKTRRSGTYGVRLSPPPRPTHSPSPPQHRPQNRRKIPAHFQRTQSKSTVSECRASSGENAANSPFLRSFGCAVVLTTVLTTSQSKKKKKEEEEEEDEGGANFWCCGVLPLLPSPSSACSCSSSCDCLFVLVLVVVLGPFPHNGQVVQRIRWAGRGHSLKEVSGGVHAGHVG